MTKRLDGAFERIRDERRTGVVPYVTVGFSTSVEDTLAIVPAMEAAGQEVRVVEPVPRWDPALNRLPGGRRTFHLRISPNSRRCRLRKGKPPWLSL